MKEIETLSKDKVKLHNEQQKKKELVLIGRQRRIPGLTLWEYNPDKNEIKKAAFEEQSVLHNAFEKDPSKRKMISKVKADEKCIYFQALNIQNAVRKLVKIGVNPVIFN